jgi:hypothetical protein
MHRTATPKANQLLAALPAAALKRLQPALELVTLPVDATLFRSTGRLPFAYFPITSIVTLRYASEAEGLMAKAWPVGSEGMVGISLFLGAPKRDNRADVQVGGLAYRLPSAALVREFARAEALQNILLRYVFALVTQASQLAVCNTYHSVEQRLCRFLSRLFDRLPGEAVEITQERIGELLGVRRVSITHVASQLHAAGIITYHRGHLKLIDREQLEQRACSCGARIRRAFAEVTT